MSLDLAAVPAVHLQLLLRYPAVAETYRDKLRAELERRGSSLTGDGEARLGPVPRVSVAAESPASVYVVIRPEPPSANDIKRWLYHPMQKHRYARYRETLTRLFAGLALVLPYPARCSHRWRLPTHPRDEDSFGLSLKPVFDALVAAKCLPDDRALALTFAGQEAGGTGARAERSCTLHFESIP